ncbi:MAG: hypothetical protein CSA29_01515 [Desulfobacterales bacterium]|nr:MAG: hypothetical protein CSA29_01515 [Desulfobacterales bacterium]
MITPIKKEVELLSRVWDHISGKIIKEFRMLTVCWSDGARVLSLDFVLLSSSNVEKTWQLLGEDNNSIL